MYATVRHRLPGKSIIITDLLISHQELFLSRHKSQCVQVAVCLLQSTVLVLPASADIDLLRRIYKEAIESDKSKRNMCALQLLMLTFARPKNFRFAQW